MTPPAGRCARCLGPPDPRCDEGFVTVDRRDPGYEPPVARCPRWAAHLEAERLRLALAHAGLGGGLHDRGWQGLDLASDA